MTRGYYDLPGGDTNLIAPFVGERKGVFANNPAMSPKYHTGNNDESLESMARLFIPFGSPKARKAFLDDVQKISMETWFAARALATTGKLGEDGAYGVGFIDFLLQKANESFQEKMQVTDVLSDNYTSYFFGQAPPMFQYSGALLNSHQDSWRAVFTMLYQHVLRGTQMARRKVVVTLAYDNVMVTGVLANLSQLLTAEFELAVDFNFNMLVKRYDITPRYINSIIQPTQTKTFPYKVTPGLFTDRQVETVNASIADAGEIRFTTAARSKPAGAEADSSGITIREPGLVEKYKLNTLWNSGATGELLGTYATASAPLSNFLSTVLGK